MVLIPGGILEEHGPYLPSYTDGYADEAYTRQLAKPIVARPGWKVVLFPQIPLGNDPANTIGGKTGRS
jgi:creatinine amidohydrolase/Fe(II)-dependent formamide hydrolase-like protein